MEVTTGAGGYRHIRPNEVNRPKTGLAQPAEGAITEESMTSSGNSEIIDGCSHTKPETVNSGDGVGGDSGDSRTTIHFLPPALNCMVRLWDEIATDMLQVTSYIYIHGDEFKKHKRKCHSAVGSRVHYDLSRSDS